MARLGGWWILLLLAFPVTGEPVLRVAIGEANPPYRFSNPPSGIEYDLLTAVISRMGYRPELVMVPKARARLLFDQGKVDAARVIDGDLVSKPYITFQNAAITLADRSLDIQTVDDLRKYRVVGFQDARLVLGSDFANMAAANPRYSENSSQLAANYFFFGGTFDVVICDVHIFDWSIRQPGQGAARPVVLHDLFPLTRYRIAFHDSDLRDRFDKALGEVLAEDPFPALLKKYLPDPMGAAFGP